MADIVFDILLNAILVTGLVIVMMMIIECFNVLSRGKLVSKVSRSGPLQIIFSALLGAVPGCMGGFAVVSMYTHGMISFGALIAMMVASSGDESFVMLAMIPGQALMIFLGLTVFSILAGLLVDRFYKPSGSVRCCSESFAVHGEDGISGSRHFGWKRICILIGVSLFLAALCFGFLEHGHDAGAPEAEYFVGGINLLSEDWMNVMFAILGVSVLILSAFAGDHFVNEHLWHHIVREHLPKIFLWTAGTLAVITILLQNVDVSDWICENELLLIIIAAAIGIIPESGPHMIFVTLFAAGIVPLPVLVASCISQDGHAALPLLAEDKKAFAVAKAINFVLAIVAGFGLELLQNL